ncbi:MAG TPA: RNA-binding S4 domain-containing protein [Acidimicrobiales bacterium]|nr:RNA-binding S4 domain-containing protein [Acidimicrobiales bacterium]
MTPPTEVTRIDRWLWAVRVYRTRAAATEACRGGHVEVNGSAAKPATPVRAGARVTARLRDREVLLEVIRVIDRRVGAPVAAGCVIDHTPAVPPRDPTSAAFARDPAAGRPTKRDRRQLDRLRRR